MDRKTLWGPVKPTPTVHPINTICKNSVPQQVLGDGALRPPMSDTENVEGDSVGAVGSSYESAMNEKPCFYADSKMPFAAN